MSPWLAVCCPAWGRMCTFNCSTTISDICTFTLGEPVRDHTCGLGTFVGITDACAQCGAHAKIQTAVIACFMILFACPLLSTPGGCRSDDTRANLQSIALVSSFSTPCCPAWGRKVLLSYPPPTVACLHLHPGHTRARPRMCVLCIFALSCRVRPVWRAYYALRYRRCLLHGPWPSVYSPSTLGRRGQVTHEEAEIQLQSLLSSSSPRVPGVASHICFHHINRHFPLCTFSTTDLSLRCARPHMRGVHMV